MLEMNTTKKRRRFFTSYHIEIVYYISQIMYGQKALKFILDESSWVIERVTLEDEYQVKKILYHYADKTFSFTDATSFVIMKRLGINTVISLDQHFRQYGFNVLG